MLAHHDIRNAFHGMRTRSDTRSVGWLNDKYGLSWQIVPTVVAKVISDPDPARAARVFQAIMGMKKLDIKALKKAYAKR